MRARRLQNIAQSLVTAVIFRANYGYCAWHLTSRCTWSCSTAYPRKAGQSRRKSFHSIRRKERTIGEASNQLADCPAMPCCSTARCVGRPEQTRVDHPISVPQSFACLSALYLASFENLSLALWTHYTPLRAFRTPLRPLPPSPSSPSLLHREETAMGAAGQAVFFASLSLTAALLIFGYGMRSS